MSDKIGNEPASPCIHMWSDSNGGGQNQIETGMTIRQKACLMAMQGLAHVNSRIYPEELANDAVRIADAVLKREKDSRGEAQTAISNAGAAADADKQKHHKLMCEMIRKEVEM